MKLVPCMHETDALNACVQVNYNYDEYDRTIKDAIRGGRHEVLLPSARPQRDWSR